MTANPDRAGGRPTPDRTTSGAFKYTPWHQLAAVRTHLVFLAGARRRGDAYGPFDFIPEITHRLAEGREGTVRPDGLLYRSRTSADGARVTNPASVEIDRATMGGPRLAAKLNAYARYRATAPLPAGVRPGTIEAEDGGARGADGLGWWRDRPVR
ncbi:replication-relaxation family protein [Kitasatospora aureofaciens]|uniref:replication-relaxation family protein n=1 Tax=Kitasatospora aureofaciens TaxID=1894 RepID=UPI0037C5BBD7